MLKAHENDVKEITEEKEKGNTTYFGSIWLMLKAKTIKESNYDMEKCDDDEHIFVGVESYFEKKLVGDSRYDYTYYNGKNHMSSVSMLTRKNEK